MNIIISSGKGEKDAKYINVIAVGFKALLKKENWNRESRDNWTVLDVLREERAKESQEEKGDENSSYSRNIFRYWIIYAHRKEVGNKKK